MHDSIIRLGACWGHRSLPSFCFPRPSPRAQHTELMIHSTRLSERLLCARPLLDTQKIRHGPSQPEANSLMGEADR